VWIAAPEHRKYSIPQLHDRIVAIVADEQQRAQRVRPKQRAADAQEDVSAPERIAQA
jgi:hypothetical protein